jgi:hypothetical protein
MLFFIAQKVGFKSNHFILLFETFPIPNRTLLVLRIKKSDKNSKSIFFFEKIFGILSRKIQSKQIK